MRIHHLLASIFFVLILILGFLFVLKPELRKASAVVSACTASVSPSIIARNTTDTFSFSINNTSAQNISWVQITRPNSNYTLLGVIINGGFSSVASYEDKKIFTNGTLVSGGSTEIAIRVTSTDQEIGSENWNIAVSDNASGTSPTNCTGSLGTEISGAGPDSDPPVISAITISNVTSSSVTLSWTTDENATSYIDYGLTDSVDIHLENNTLSTTHSHTLTGLSENTTYYFYVGNDDENGNNSEIDLSTFTTAVTGSTGETVVITNTVTNTNTQLITPSPTPTPIPDRNPPTVTIETDLSKAFDKSPKITGSASDPSGVVKIEYSLDGGRNYLRVDKISQPGARSTKFEFTPVGLDDDNYNLKIRAQDGSAQFNIGETKYDLQLIIDRLAPQISGLIYSFGPHVMNPRIDGSLVAVAGVPFKVTLSSVGGPTDVSIFWPEKNESAYSKLSKNQDNSLWSGQLKFEEEGEYQMKFSAIDGASNKIETELNKIIVVGKGKVLNEENEPINKEGKLTVFYEEPKSKKWVKWNGEAYSQENPVKIDQKGNYALFLPKGRYYINIDVDGYQKQNLDIFEISEPTFINANFKLKQNKQLFGFGPLKFYIPDFSTLSVPFRNNIPEPGQNSNSLLDKQIPYFALNSFNTSSLRGKNSLITIFNSWSPQAAEQISILDEIIVNNNFNIVAIAEGDSSSKALIFGKRGKYSVPIISDNEASIVNTLKLNILPMHYFLDRFGNVKQVKTGVLGKEEMENLLNAN